MSLSPRGRLERGGLLCPVLVLIVPRTDIFDCLLIHRVYLQIQAFHLNLNQYLVGGIALRKLSHSFHDSEDCSRSSIE